jgi:MFS family permease
MALVATAVPGFVVAALLRWTISEPQRGRGERGNADLAPLRLNAALSQIWKQRSLRHLLAATALCYIVVAGMGSWHFSFLVRIHSLELHEIGPLLGVGMALMGVVSNVGAGVLSDRLGAYDERWRTRSLAIGAVLIAVIGYGSLLTPAPRVAVVLVILFGASVVFWFPTVAALSQSLVEPRLRATVAGLLFLLANLVGYGLGPLLIGGLSDLLAASQGKESLRYALVFVLSLLVWASMHFLLAGRSLRADLARVHFPSEGS